MVFSFSVAEVQKEFLAAQIKIEITNLEEAKNKINTETDATALKQEKQSIIDSYKSYNLYVPEIEIIAHADKIIDIAQALATKTTNENLLKIISTAQTKAQTVIDLLIKLSPEETNNKTTLQTARDMLKDSRTGLNTVYSTLNSK